MKYTIKAGVLYKNESQLALARIKSVLLGPQRKILSIAGELLLTADVRYLDESKASSGDVRNREYLLTDNENQLVGSARPGCQSCHGETEKETGSSAKGNQNSKDRCSDGAGD